MWLDLEVRVPNFQKSYRHFRWKQQVAEAGTDFHIHLSSKRNSIANYVQLSRPASHCLWYFWYNDQRFRYVAQNQKCPTITVNIRSALQNTVLTDSGTMTTVEQLLCVLLVVLIAFPLGAITFNCPSRVWYIEALLEYNVSQMSLQLGFLR